MERVKEVKGVPIVDLPPLLTVDQFAQLVQLRPIKIRAVLAQGKIPGGRLGGGPERPGRWRIPRSVIERFLAM